MSYVIVGFGGILGAVLRYLVSRAFREVLEKDHPVATLFINVIGCFLIGYFSTKHLNIKNRLFLTTGILGGFTTYSTFMLESSRYIKKSKYKKALIYISLSLICGLIAAGAGIYLGKMI